MSDYFEVTFFNKPDFLIASGWGMIKWRDWCERTLKAIAKPDEKLWIHTMDDGRIGIVSDQRAPGWGGYQFKKVETGVSLETMTEED
jgi:hypothetical protein